MSLALKYFTYVMLQLLSFLQQTIQCVLKEISHYEHPDTVVNASKTLGPLSFKR